jgi:hypothetical protein
MISNRKPASHEERPRAHATFTLSGDAVSPDFWTGYFGINPNISVIKGQPFITPSGCLSSVPGRTGVWGIHSKSAVHEDSLSPHLRYLISRLGLPRDDFLDLLRETGAMMRFLCYWDNYSGNRVPDIPNDIRDLVSSFGGAIEIDEYPQKQKFIGQDGEKDVWV